MTTRYSADPSGALADVKTILEKAKKADCAKLSIAATALRARDVVRHGSPLKIALTRSLLTVVTSRDLVRLLRTLLVKILRNVKPR